MKIAVICSDIGIRIPGSKGASIHLQSICNAFVALGHDVLLVGVAGHGDPPENFASLLLPHPGRSEGLRREVRKLKFNRRMFRLAMPVVREFAPDVIYERLALFGTAGLRLSREMGVRHVLEINSLLTDEEVAWRSLRLRRLARKRENRVLRGSHLRIAVSEQLSQKVEKRCGLKVACVPNGVETELFLEMPARGDAREALGLPAGVPMVGFTGSLRPWHGLDVAIDALRMLDGVELAVAGGGDLKQELQARAAQLGVAERVHWLGQLLHSQIPSFLAAVDVAVAPYPSLDDFAYSPLKLYEYLASGTPTVASSIGQIPDILDGFGILVSPGESVELAAAIQHILDHRSEAVERAARGRKWVLAHHGWTQRAQDIIAMISLEARHAVAR